MSRRVVDLTGKRFGKMVVIGRSEKKAARILWDTVCDCGGTRCSSGNTLQQGKATSCGCLNREISSRNLRALVYRHGMSNTPTHKSWLSMLNRCNLPTFAGYSRYGGRGIKVCERWHLFENFLADMGERPAGTSIDRIDNSKGYEPENCRWATAREQARNRSFVINVTHGGETKCVTEWCEAQGLQRERIYSLIAKGVPPVVALGLEAP